MFTIGAHYSFLPWMRRGLGNRIEEVENFGQPNGAKERAEIDIQVAIKDKQGTDLQTDGLTLSMYGPGDIIGLSKDAIVRVEPSDWITNFEYYNLPFIEFYDEDLPWRYSPAVPNQDDQLRPWLFLLVLKKDEFERLDPTKGPLPSLKLVATQTPFPPVDQAWAWAHVHVNADLDTNVDPDAPQANTVDKNAMLSRLEGLLDENPDIAVSRIIAPRRLERDTDYHAFLIPSFETGRLAGLGQPITNVLAQAASWGDAQTDYPFYHEWYFRTGAAGDFEQLIRQIVPRAMPSGVGMRELNLHEPGLEMNGLPEGDEVRSFAGALKVPGVDPEPYAVHDADNDTYTITGNWLDLIKELEDRVNQGEDLVESAAPPTHYGPDDDDPIVAPPMYGRWHALKRKVDRNSMDWINELNLDPRNRAAAELGAQYIRENQDYLMDLAWDQIGDVLEANKLINMAQLAKEVNDRLYEKHIKTLPKELKVNLTKELQGVLFDTGKGLTVGATFEDSALPNGVGSATFRRVARAGGPVMKKLHTSATAVPTRAAAMNTTQVLVTELADSTIEVQEQTSATNHLRYVPQADADQSLTQAIAQQPASGNTFTLTLNAFSSNLDQTDFHTAISELDGVLNTNRWWKEELGPDPDLNQVSNFLDTDIQAGQSVISRTLADLSLFSVADEVVTPELSPEPDKIVPILGAPAFVAPSYQALLGLSTDHFLSNLHKVPQNTFSLLETNPRFIESFMVGLNHEMGKELLWREYPTDQRGSYFRMFWDKADATPGINEPDESALEESLQDIPPIHEWPSNTLLGSRLSADDMGGKMVFLIRGDVFRKFPNAVVYAIPAKWGNTPDDGEEATRVPDMDAIPAYPIFGATVDPDILFLGFDLSEEEIKGNDPVVELSSEVDLDGNQYTFWNGDAGYFFVIQERPGELRFGLDIPVPDSPTPDLSTWEDLNWEHLDPALSYISLDPSLDPNDGKRGDHIEPLMWTTSSTSADIAMILMQKPVMACIHAREMIPAS